MPKVQELYKLKINEIVLEKAAMIKAKARKSGLSHAAQGGLLAPLETIQYKYGDFAQDYIDGFNRKYDPKLQLLRRERHFNKCKETNEKQRKSRSAGVMQTVPVPAYLLPADLPKTSYILPLPDDIETQFDPLLGEAQPEAIQEHFEMPKKETNKRAYSQRKVKGMGSRGPYLYDKMPSGQRFKILQQRIRNEIHKLNNQSENNKINNSQSYGRIRKLILSLSNLGCDITNLRLDCEKFIKEHYAGSLKGKSSSETLSSCLEQIEKLSTDSNPMVALSDKQQSQPDVDVAANLPGRGDEVLEFINNLELPPLAVDFDTEISPFLLTQYHLGQAAKSPIKPQRDPDNPYEKVYEFAQKITKEKEETIAGITALQPIIELNGTVETDQQFKQALM